MATAKRYVPEAAPAVEVSSPEFKVGDKVIVFDSSLNPPRKGVVDGFASGRVYVNFPTVIKPYFPEQLRHQPPAPAERVTLDMSLEEAETVATIMAKIGGCPDRSRRKHSDSVGGALYELKVEYDTSDTHSSIYFKDRK